MALLDRELIRPQSHAPWLLHVSNGRWKQMAAQDRVGAKSCLAPGPALLHRTEAALMYDKIVGVLGTGG